MAARHATDSIRNPPLGWAAAWRLLVCLAVFLLAMTTAETGQAHSGSHRQQTAAGANQHNHQTRLGQAQGSQSQAIEADIGNRQRDKDSNSSCARGPLHAHCAAGGASCVTPGDHGLDLIPDGAALAPIRPIAHISGLAPPPLDRPPR